jgi:hypothetical protein
VLINEVVDRITYILGVKGLSCRLKRIPPHSDSREKHMYIIHEDLYGCMCRLQYNLNKTMFPVLATSRPSGLGLATSRPSHPVRIRVRIDPTHPLVCRKRRLNGAVLQMRPEKPRPRVKVGVAR